MYPELHIRIWMSSKSDALMIIGTLMDQEICLILGQVSLNFTLLEEKPPDGYMWARGMGSPRHGCNRRRRTREGPEPACVQTPFVWEVHTQGREG